MFKYTTFLVKHTFLLLRTIKDVLMKLTYALLRKQRTHNLRYIVRTLLMKLAPEVTKRFKNILQQALGSKVLRLLCILIVGVN